MGGWLLQKGIQARVRRLNHLRHFRLWLQYGEEASIPLGN